MKKIYKSYLMIICLIVLSILSTKVNAQHFNFEGGNPSEPFWTLYIAEAAINENDLEAGDEIAIFDGEIMVGAFTLTQVCTPENQFENVLLAFNTLASGNPGYTPGDNVLFKCWDADLGIEISDFEISFDNPYGDAWTQSIFPSDDGEYSLIHLDFEWIHTGDLAGTISDEINLQPIAGALVEISSDLSYFGATNANGNYLIEDIEAGIYSVIVNADGYFPKTINGVEILAGEATILDFALEPIIQTQTFDLTTGFQFASTRLVIENPEMLNLLEGILDNLDFVRNSQGYMLRKIGPNWINNIGDWVTTEGYLFKMNSDDSFEISGEAIEEYTPIELTIGFQIISYLPSEPRDCEEVFSNILDNLDFVRNSTGAMFRKIGPNWINSIGDMQPGEGYLVKMIEENVLLYREWECGDPIVDNRDGETYQTILIGNQCWMAENLNIGEMINGGSSMTNNSVIEKYCYDNNTANCETYGGLYQWNEMMQYYPIPGVQGICPDGWHLPTDDEWTILTDFLGGESVAAGKMKETGTTHWSSPNTGATNESGFTALPGGVCSSSGYFSWLTSTTLFWSSSENNGSGAWYRALGNSSGGVGRSTYFKTNGCSVRCLQD